MATTADIGDPFKLVIDHAEWGVQWPKAAPPVIVDPFVWQKGPQIRFPRSKRARIRKKWANRIENYRRDPSGYMMKGKLVLHPSIYHQVVAALRDKGYQFPISTNIS
jgi:hypothetical protein